MVILRQVDSGIDLNFSYSDVIVMSDEYQEYAEPINEEEEDGNTTTVQFIAVSADEHERMIREGELPATIQVHTSI